MVTIRSLNKKSITIIILLFGAADQTQSAAAQPPANEEAKLINPAAAASTTRCVLPRNKFSKHATINQAIADAFKCPIPKTQKDLSLECSAYTVRSHLENVPTDPRVEIFRKALGFRMETPNIEQDDYFPILDIYNQEQALKNANLLIEDYLKKSREDSPNKRNSFSQFKQEFLENRDVLQLEPETQALLLQDIERALDVLRKLNPIGFRLLWEVPEFTVTPKPKK